MEVITKVYYILYFETIVIVWTMKIIITLYSIDLNTDIT